MILYIELVYNDTKILVINYNTYYAHYIVYTITMLLNISKKK